MAGAWWWAGSAALQVARWLATPSHRSLIAQSQLLESGLRTDACYGYHLMAGSLSRDNMNRASRHFENLRHESDQRLVRSPIHRRGCQRDLYCAVMQAHYLIK